VYLVYGSEMVGLVEKESEALLGGNGLRLEIINRWEKKPKENTLYQGMCGG
jgi:hypothetical protein